MDEYMIIKNDWGIVIYSLVIVLWGDVGYFFNVFYMEGGVFNVGYFYELVLIFIINKFNKIVD